MAEADRLETRTVIVCLPRDKCPMLIGDLHFLYFLRSSLHAEFDHGADIAHANVAERDAVHLAGFFRKTMDSGLRGRRRRGPWTSAAARLPRSCLTTAARETDGTEPATAATMTDAAVATIGAIECRRWRRCPDNESLSDSHGSRQTGANSTTVAALSVLVGRKSGGCECGLPAHGRKSRRAHPGRGRA